MRTFDALVRFVGHVDPIRRPATFPTEVYEDVIIRAATRVEFMTKLNDVVSLIVGRQGMVVLRKDAAAVQPADLSFQHRTYIPMAMFTHVDAIIRPITGETPSVEEDGAAFVGEGLERSQVKPN